MVKLSPFFDSKVKKNIDSNERKRSKEHVHGNWATLIFIPIKLTEEIEEKIKEIVKEQAENVKLEAVDPICPDAPYHLSLSRTLYIKDHQKDLFKQKIESALRRTRNEFPLPLKVKCDNFGVYLNDEGTRTFLAIDFKEDIILNYIKTVDEILKQFHLPVYYDPPKLHFSVLHCPGNRREILLKNVQMNSEIVAEVELKEIFIKCGNKITKI